MRELIPFWPDTAMHDIRFVKAGVQFHIGSPVIARATSMPEFKASS